jgi:hypothetical protein
MALVEPSVAEQALRWFVEEVERIPGARVVLQGGRVSGIPTIRIFLPTRGSKEWRQVQALEDRLMDDYPQARLDVWLSEERPKA